MARERIISSSEIASDHESHAKTIDERPSIRPTTLDQYLGHLI